MTPPRVAGRHIEIFFADADHVVDVEMEDEDPAFGRVVVDAIERDDVDDAVAILRDNVAGDVRRRP